MSDWDQLKKSQGVYVLVLQVTIPIIIDTKKNNWKLQEGYYLYFGSAKGNTALSLGNRLARHFKAKKKIFWHIDYLSTHPKVLLIISYFIITTEISECSAFQEFRQSFQETEIILKFGSSDCKNRCRGHLLFYGNENNFLIKLKEYFSLRKWNSTTKYPHDHSNLPSSF